MDRTYDETGINEESQSTYSYDSTRDWSQFFKEIDGRIFNNQSSPYILPAGKHSSLVGLGGLYPCPDLVENILAPQPGVTKEILDLGCGTGIWALSMARQFPHARVRGVDLTPTPLREDQMPANIEFEIDDINLGLGHFANRFDLVHMRCVAGGLPNFEQGITYAAQCVKPGGMLIVVDYEMLLCAEDMVTTQKMATANQPEGSWLQRYLYEVRSTFVVNGTDPFKGAETLDRGLWEHLLLTECGVANMFNPIGPWQTSSDPEETQRLKFGGILVRQSLKAGIRAFHTLLKKNGISQDVIDEFTAKADAELDSLRLHNWMRLCLLWGIRKPLDQNQATVSESTPPQQTTTTNWQPHRTIRVYRTQEESLAARKLRQDTIGEIVEPQVLLANK
ncbi:S-adenosyl-L-methionine-dependent methyltransferase [Serendipita vermifera]|nr:S-adenosyl-L-methionine-dependent methyltransferase [Serendipita vermifera]